jgi:hypothetical protein
MTRIAVLCPKLREDIRSFREAHPGLDSFSWGIR